MDDIILVTPTDDVLGLTNKMAAHRYAMLHRAFSIFIYRIRDGERQILLQQRQLTKYHCGGLWTNTCCSHPKPDETLEQSAERRLMEELGIKASLTRIGQFHYVAVLDNGFFENELDHVLIGECSDDAMTINPEEVNAVQWLSESAVKDWLRREPGVFTPWFAPAFEILLNNPLPPPSPASGRGGF